MFVVGLTEWYLKSVVSRKFYSYFEYKKITPLNLRLSLVLFLSKLLQNCLTMHEKNTLPKSLIHGTMYRQAAIFYEELLCPERTKRVFWSLFLDTIGTFLFPYILNSSYLKLRLVHACTV